jgi:hypothetical protein
LKSIGKELYFIFKFHIFSKRKEFLSQLNQNLCQTFKERRRRRSTSSTSSKISIENCKQRAMDVKIYIGHLMSMILHLYPSLSRKEETISCCFFMIEKIVFEEIDGDFVSNCFHFALENVNKAFLYHLLQIQRNTQAFSYCCCCSSSSSSSCG